MNRPEHARQSHDAHLTPLRLSMYADGETPREERAEIEAHLGACRACSAKLEALRAVSATLGALPRTAPSADVFDKVLSGARSIDRASNAVGRERLGRARSSGPHLREVRLPDMDAPGPITSARRRSRWRLPLTGALPTIAALLLLTLTAGLLLRSSLLTTTPFLNTTPTATIPPGETLNATRNAMDSAASHLSFKPVKPSYLPGGARLGAVQAIALGPGMYGLDVTWTMSAGPLLALHLREQPASAPISGYNGPAAQTAGLAWQLSAYPVWRAMTRVEQPGGMGVEQTIPQASGPVRLLLDAQPAPGASPSDVAIQLRLTSLSLDGAYTPTPIYISMPTGALLTRAIAIVDGAGGQTWGWDVTSDTNAIQVNATITSPDGTKLTQITRSGAGVLLDWNRRVYQKIQGPTLYTPPPSSVTQIATGANTFLDWGLLWNLGPTNITLPGAHSSIIVYDLYRVDAALPEHVYADATTGVVVAISIDIGSNISPGGPGSPQPYVSKTVCPSHIVTYNWIIFEPATQSSSLFNTAPPSSSSGWKAGSVPLPFTCGG